MALALYLHDERTTNTFPSAKAMSSVQAQPTLYSPSKNYSADCYQMRNWLTGCRIMLDSSCGAKSRYQIKKVHKPQRHNEHHKTIKTMLRSHTGVWNDLESSFTS